MASTSRGGSSPQTAGMQPSVRAGNLEGGALEHVSSPGRATTVSFSSPKTRRKPTEYSRSNFPTNRGFTKPSREQIRKASGRNSERTALSASIAMTRGQRDPFGDGLQMTGYGRTGDPELAPGKLASSSTTPTDTLSTGSHPPGRKPRKQATASKKPLQNAHDATGARPRAGRPRTPLFRL